MTMCMTLDQRESEMQIRNANQGDRATAIEDHLAKIIWQRSFRAGPQPASRDEPRNEPRDLRRNRFGTDIDGANPGLTQPPGMAFSRDQSPHGFMGKLEVTAQGPRPGGCQSAYSTECMDSPRESEDFSGFLGVRGSVADLDL